MFYEFWKTKVLISLKNIFALTSPSEFNKQKKFLMQKYEVSTYSPEHSYFTINVLRRQ